MKDNVFEHQGTTRCMPHISQLQVRTFKIWTTDQFSTMLPSVPISSLLNPASPNSSLPPVNLEQQLALVAGLCDRPLPSDAPPHVMESLSHVISYFKLDRGTEQHRGSTIPRLINSPLVPGPTIRRNVYINHKTMLSVLYTYEDLNTWIEYPETNPDRPVGYLFCCNPLKWDNPVRNFAYSLSRPSGQTRRGQEVEHPLLVDKYDQKVLCVVEHSTCMLKHNII